MKPAPRRAYDGAHLEILRRIVQDHCYAVDAKIRATPKSWGVNSLKYDLPSWFSVPGISRTAAQTIVYSCVLRHLSRAGHDARIAVEPNRTTLYVRWMTQLSAVENEAMLAVIRAHSIEPGEVRAFVEGKDLAAARKPPAFHIAGPRSRPLLHRGGTALPPPVSVVPPKPGAGPRAGPSRDEADILGLD